MKHQPKTPAPWSEIPCYFDNQCRAFEPKDADHIVHCVNAYPNLVETLSTFIEHDHFTPSALAAIVLLRELGELD